MVDRFGLVRLVDFGNASFADEVDVDVAGTLPYSSPELMWRIIPRVFPHITTEFGGMYAMCLHSMMMHRVENPSPYAVDIWYVERNGSVAGVSLHDFTDFLQVSRLRRV